MHLYVGMRGEKTHMDRLISDLQAQYFPIPMKDVKTNVIREDFVQLSVRPVQFFELVFPEAGLQDVMRMLNLDGGKPFPGHVPKGFKKYLGVIRRLLKAEKLPKVEPGPKRVTWTTDYTQIMPIGCRKDKEITKDINGKPTTFEGL